MTATASNPTWTVTRNEGHPESRILEEILALASASAEADGNPPLSEQTLVNLRSRDSGAPRVLVLTARPGAEAGDDGELAGVAVLSLAAATADTGPESGVLELVVAPDCRGEGVGTALAEAVRAENIPGLKAWSHGNHPAAADLGARFGLKPVRELWRMRLTRAALEEAAPDVVLPEGVRLRAFVPGQDEEAWLETNRAAFAHHPEQGATTLADLRARMAEDWFDREGFLLAERTGEPGLLGFHWTKVHPAVGAHPPMGEVYVVGVAPRAQGSGLGKALTVAGINSLHRRGLQAIMLYVDADNTAAVALYRRLGFTRWDVDVMYSRLEDTPSL
ncbi:mycothiol synthase [Arthrobacter sp. Br18]|uniref:mycothiol synthase n=1 Tax=Arthrobacter sp. Br18 TaxID=1312954 RepID=UPI00047B6B43|nr:mycothiol synthase [Arthrobacter sp. Br18]